MTILFSAYTDVGIIFASDDRITERLGRTGKTRTIRRKAQQKVFNVDGLGSHAKGGLLGFFGSAMVKDKQMDDWLREAMPQCRRNAETSEFAADLRDALKSAPFESNQRSATGFHVGAFEKRDGVQVPVFHFVTNIHDMQDGYYTKLGDFFAEEQLLSRDLRGLESRHIQSALRVFEWENGYPRWYRNGDVPFHGPVTTYLMAAIAHVVNGDRARKRGDYQVPATLDGWAAYVTTLVETTIGVASLLFVKGEPRIGGTPTVKVLDWPS